jgi:hypothetical protein
MQEFEFTLLSPKSFSIVLFWSYFLLILFIDFGQGFNWGSKGVRFRSIQILNRVAFHNRWVDWVEARILLVLVAIANIDSKNFTVVKEVVRAGPLKGSNYHNAV